MESATPDFTWLFVKMVAGLVLVLGLALVFIRYVLPKTRLGKRRGVSWIEVVSSFSIEPHKNLHMVKLGGRYLVLGVTEHSLNLVTELSQAEGEKIEAS